MSVLVAQNARTDPLGLIEAPLRNAGLDLEIWWPKTEPPPDVREFAAVIALGGATNPDEDAGHPWLAAERRLLARAVELRRPVLGVCLGAQLLAQALGASAYRLRRPRIGYSALCPLAAVEDDPLGHAWPPVHHVLEWHAYGFTLPPDGVLLAGTRSAVQAFRAGPCAWGFQYHLEAGADERSGWIRDFAPDLAAAGVEAGALAAAAGDHAPDAERHGTVVGETFAALVADRRAAVAG
jgi:GMP synthase (glutamine-hydrolysing)